MPKKFKFGFDMKNVDWVKVSTCVLALLAVVLAIMILVKVDKSKQGFSLRGKKLEDDSCISTPQCAAPTEIPNCCQNLKLFWGSETTCCLGPSNNNSNPYDDPNCGNICMSACDGGDINCYSKCIKTCPKS
jgi:hypothetical protein